MNEMGQMDRAERRRRAKCAQERHDRQWRELYGYEPRQPGRGRKLSHLDCGKSDCGTCRPGTSPEPEWDEEEEPRHAARRCRKPKTIGVEYRRVQEQEGTHTPHWSKWKKYATIEAACKAVAALNHSWQSGHSLWEFRLQPEQEQA